MLALRQHKNNEFYLIGCPYNSSNRCQDNKQAESKICTELRTGETLFRTGNRITPPSTRVKHIRVVFDTQTATSNLSSELYTLHPSATRSDLIKLFKFHNAARRHSPSQVPDACHQTSGHAATIGLPKFLPKSHAGNNFDRHLK